MNIPQIQDGLKRLFFQEQQRIVFWYDAEGEFEETVAALQLEPIQVLLLDKLGALEVKIRLEQQDVSGKYLLYAPTPEPAPEEDWLLDIRLYSRCFYADQVSLWLEELGLHHQALRTYLSQRKKFLSSQSRLQSLKKWVHPQDQGKELDLKMLVVLTRSEQPELFAVLINLLSGFCRDGDASLDQLPDDWEALEKFDLVSSFWNSIQDTFGYTEEKPSLKNFLLRLMVTDFTYSFKVAKGSSAHSSSEHPTSEKVLAPLNPLRLPKGVSTSNAVVFLSQWRDNLNHFQHYEQLSGCVAEEIQLSNLLQNTPEESLLDVMTFEQVEQTILSGLRDQLLSEKVPSLEAIQPILERRLDGHWAKRLLADKQGSKQNLYHSLYKALEAATALLNLQEKYKEGFSFSTPEALAQAYTQELFQFDQLYRYFHEEEDRILMHGGDVLKVLKQKLEASYSHWFMEQLSLAWGKFMEPSSGKSLLTHWKLSGISNQYQFFKDWVAPRLASSSQTKVFVIISDAFRYEAAEELTRLLNRKNRFQATLSYQLGVLPSYTGLGMAALLPHQKMTYKTNKTADILVDGHPTSSLEQRAALLESVEGTALKASTLMDLKKEEGRALAKAQRVFYLYHDTIDAIGDKAPTEGKTFSAVRDALRELEALVSHLVNTLNAGQVLLTADHGFLFQESAPEVQDKSDLEDKPEGTLKAKKRYLLGTTLPDHPKALHGKTRDTAGTDDAMEFWVPKGANRFHFAGGARFVHGGAMPQEILVPILSIKPLRGKTETTKVEVNLLGTKHKITTNRYRLELIQTEAVGGSVIARSLTIGLWDGETLISNEETLTFASESSSMDERKKSVYLLLKSGSYDKKKDYALLLRDSETKAEYQRVSVSINLAFNNDF
ncbi:MAG: BREX-1 system phosphatase PglZ type A [SAR324 cluster bacterium]|nr:BREX-1 system phosphatase PglZ type A [SAR324 cluster bacterium]